MSGLNSILEKIIEDANVSAKTRVRRAEEEAAAYSARKKSETEEEVNERLEREKEAISILESKSRSSAESEAKKRLLQEKVALIDEVLAEARSRIISLSAKENRDMIERFVRSHASELTGACELIVNARDRAAATKEFSDRLSEIIPGTLQISDEPGNFEAGCILRCGPIEFNGTVDALINEKLDEVRDRINRSLFLP